MTETLFETDDGRTVTAVTAAEMRDVDRVAVEDVGLQLLQMMENAGRNLANAVREEMDTGDEITVLAGDGGNGGGGLACARHLANHNHSVRVALDVSADELTGAAATQYGILVETSVPVDERPANLPERDLVVDALVGYGLSGPLRGPPVTLVEQIDDDATVVSLDVPTGRNATTGEEPGSVVAPDTVVTLALPKTGLTGLEAQLLLADIAIPAVVYDRLDIPYGSSFDGAYLVELGEVT